MTASTVIATNVSNRALAPVQNVLAKEMGASEKVWKGFIAAATTSIDEVGDTMILCAVPKNAVLHELIIKSTALDTHSTPTLAVDVGLYQEVISGTTQTFTALDADCFGSAILTLQAGSLLGVDVLNESGVNTLDLLGGTLYALGVDTDANKFGNYFIGLKVTTGAATAAAGKIQVIARGCI